MSRVTENYIEPLSIKTEFYTTEIIRICIDQNYFVESMELSRMGGLSPVYFINKNTNIFDISWTCAIGKNVILVGEISKDIISEFMDFLLEFGEWSVCGIDEDHNLYLKNADLFRSNGLT